MFFDNDATAVALEVKFASDPSTGEFEGYGAVFGSQDSHSDLILPGAFLASLAKRAAENRALPMYVQHGPYLGGDHLPAGVWKSVSEDQHGLKMVGQIAGMDTERGKVIHSLVKSGALGGLSIEFNVPRGGATYGQKAGDPKRTIKTANLHGVSLVADPSHAMARVDSIKSANGGFPTLREFEAALRERLGFSHSQAAHIAERGFKSLPRDGDDDLAISPALKSALAEFQAAAAGFPHPKT